MLELHMDQWERHIRILQGLSQQSILSYMRTIREFQIWLAQTYPVISDISLLERGHVEGFLESCFYRGNSNTTRSKKLIALTKYARFLVYSGKVREDITKEIPRPRVSRPLVQILTKTEVLRLFSVIDISTEKGLRDAVVIICGVFLGLRIGEVQRLTIADIVDDDSGNSLVFSVVKSKFGGSRHVRLWKVASAFVRRLLVIRLQQGAKNRDTLVVSYTRGGLLKGSPISHQTVDYLLKAYASKAAIRKHVHFHMLRATHATNLRAIQSYDLPAIASRLGHRSISTTADRYFASWERTGKTYPSLANFWKEFNHRLWLPEGRERGNHPSDDE